MSSWDHLTRIFSASPQVLEVLRIAAHALLLAGGGVFLLGLAKVMELWRPPPKQ